MSLIYDVDILDEAKDNFLTYASEVLTDRAIPSAEDGLLSAQRKILWTMEDYLKMDSNSKTKKCNALVGSTLSTSYYHGDASCYGVLCKMSQDYLMRYPLIKGQGSLGTQENNDLVASSRYTEAKPSIYADLMMNNFKKNVVPVKETYNGEYMEPVILPSLFPNAICNGRQAIGVSMSHNSAPHNLTEVCSCIIAFLQDKVHTVDDVMNYIPGPDFPLGGRVLNKKDIRAAFETGHSSVSLKIQGDYIIEDNKIIFTTIPYRTYRNKIKEQIEKNVDEFEQIIDDFDDESSVGQNKLVFYVKKGISPLKVLNKIFTLTDLQTTLSYNMNYIINGTPKLCSMLQLIKAYCNHQEAVLINATKYDLNKAEARAHILKGLIAAVDQIDEVVQIIKQADDKQNAINKLIAFLNIDSIQASAILDMKLGKLTRIDKNELINELHEKEKIIAYCKELLESKEKRIEELIKLVTNLKNKYGDERRTQLLDIEIPKEEKEKIEIIPEDCVVIVSKSGLIKRVPSKSYKTQKRNSVGIKNNDDITSFVCKTNTVDMLMIFTNKGQMYRLLVDSIPTGTNASKGVSISSLVQFEANEKPVSYASLHDGTTANYIFFCTENGMIKKTSLEEYKTIKKNKGIKAITLKDKDNIAVITFIEKEDILLITEQGMCLRFNTSDIPISSRTAQGVKGIKLNENDKVIACLPIKHNTDYLAIVSTAGEGKKVPVKEFSAQGRNTKGIILTKTAIAGVLLVDDTDEILIVGSNTSVRIPAKDIPLVESKNSIGNILIKNNRVVSVSKI